MRLRRLQHRTSVGRRAGHNTGTANATPPAHMP